MEKNINVTINTVGNAEDRQGAAAAAPIGHSVDVLVDNTTTFAELLCILGSKPEAIEAAQQEAQEKAREEKEAKLREAYGDDYDLVFDREPKSVNPRDGLQKEKRRPGAVQLREQFSCVARIEIGVGGLCEVFNNGYAIYDNGNRKTVLWVPDCGAVTYYFGKLKDNEKEYLSEKSEIGADDMGGMPWYYALLIAGENRIEYNMEHPKSVGNTSDFDLESFAVKPASHWVGACHFDNPEEALLKKEAEEERKMALTDKQREVYVMYYELGMTEQEIACACNIARRTARDRLALITKKYQAEPEKYFL